MDIVSNMILVGTAHHANKKELKVVHSSSSNRKPINWGNYTDYVLEYLKYNPYHIQAFKPYIVFITNEKLHKTRFYLNTELPVLVLDKISKIPGIGTSAMK